MRRGGARLFGDQCLDNLACSGYFVLSTKCNSCGAHVATGVERGMECVWSEQSSEVTLDAKQN